MPVNYSVWDLDSDSNRTVLRKKKQNKNLHVQWSVQISLRISEKMFMKITSYNLFNKY